MGGEPSYRLLTQNGNEWSTELLYEAEDLTSPENISMRIVNQSEEQIIVEFQNSNSSKWVYGLMSSLHVLLDEKWYVVPEIPGTWVVPSIALIVQPDSVREEEYSIKCYGSLPTGHYRFVVEGLSVEFEVQ